MALFRFGKSSAESSPRTEEEPGAAKPSVFDRLRRVCQRLRRFSIQTFEIC